VLQRALEGRSGRTERSKGAQGRIMHQRPENRGALDKPTINALNDALGNALRAVHNLRFW